MIIKYHTHHGSDCDGNGLFFYDDTFVDLSAGITSHHNEESAYGQCGAYEKHTRHSHITRGLTVAQQVEIRSLLDPFIALTDKYPAMRSFRYFTAKQRYFLTGKLSKAIELAKGSDYHGIDNLASVFTLPHLNLIVRIYAGTQDRYSHFTVRVSPATDESDSDYWTE